MGLTERKPIQLAGLVAALRVLRAGVHSLDVKLVRRRVPTLNELRWLRPAQSEARQRRELVDPSEGTTFAPEVLA